MSLLLSNQLELTEINHIFLGLKQILFVSVSQVSTVSILNTIHQLNKYDPTSKNRPLFYDPCCFKCSLYAHAAKTRVSIYPCAPPFFGLRSLPSPPVFSISKMLVFCILEEFQWAVREQHESIFLTPRPCVSLKAKTNIHLFSKLRGTGSQIQRNVLGLLVAVVKLFSNKRKISVGVEEFLLSEENLLSVVYLSTCLTFNVH